MFGISRGQLAKYRKEQFARAEYGLLCEALRKRNMASKFT